MRQDFPSFEPAEPAASVQPLTRSVNASYRALRRARQSAALRAAGAEYDGGPGDWLAPLLPPESDQPTGATPHIAELNAWCAIAALAISLALMVGGLADPPLLAGGGMLLVGAVVAVALNRASEPGWASAALVVATTAAPVAVALFAAPGDPTLAFALDALVAPVLLAGLLLAARAPLVVGGAAALAAVLVLLPRQFGNDPSGMLRAHLLSQALLEPVGLIVLVSLLAWLWAAAMERALARTASNAAATARYSSLDEQQAHLDRGTQAILATLAQVANGQYNARVDSGTRTVLWQLATPLNSLITRLAATAQADQQLRATERAIDQLTAALEQARGGRPPLWPSASGTRADRLTGLLATTTPRPTPIALPLPGATLSTSPRRTAAQPGGGATRPALPRHRAPDEFARDGFAQSYPAGTPATTGHAGARRMERKWASQPLPALDTSALGERPGAPRHQPAGSPRHQDAPPMPAWLFGAGSAPATPPREADTPRAERAPAWRPATPAGPNAVEWAPETRAAPAMPAWESSAPITPSPEDHEAPLEPVAANERETAPELEWSASAPEQPLPGIIPPAQSWTIVPLVPAQVERPEWPDFLITLDAVRRGEEGEPDE
jgi:hypothetical protein